MSRPFDEFEAGEIRRIAAIEGRTQSQVARLLIRLGLRMYRRTYRLTCGFRPCNRADCCGGIEMPGDERTIRAATSLLRIIDGKDGRQ